MHTTIQIHKNIIEKIDKLNIDSVMKGVIKVWEVIIKIIKIILNELIIINVIVKIIIIISMKMLKIIKVLI